MKLSEIISPTLISIGLEVSDKRDAIEKMVDLLVSSGNIDNRNDLLDAMFEREHTMTTGIGHGVAIPHAGIDGIREITVAAALLAKPIDFESIDFQPVSIIFAIACPIERGKSYMEILAQIARLFSNSEFREKLVSVATAEDFIKIIAAAEEKSAPNR